MEISEHQVLNECKVLLKIYLIHLQMEVFEYKKYSFMLIGINITEMKMFKLVGLKIN